MTENLLTETYYGNTVQAWLTSLIIIAAALVLGKMAFWFLSHVFRRFTEKTTTRLDDLLLDLIERPITFVITLVGVSYGIKVLNMPPGLRTWTDHVFQVLLILTVAWLLVRLFDSLYTEYLAPLASKTDTDLDDQLLPVVRKSTKTIIWVLAIIIALDNAGYDVGALLAGLGIGGLAMAMAAKDTVSNVFGGFTIFVDKPFTLNDRIQVSGFDGVVKEVGLRSTRLETLAGRIVTIPNSRFSENPVENISIEPSRKVSVQLGLTYDTTSDQIEEALQLLKEIAAENPNLEEKVVAVFSGFGDFSLNLTFIYYIKKGSDIFQTQNDVNLAVLRRFNERSLEFAFPTQTIYSKQS